MKRKRSLYKRVLAAFMAVLITLTALPDMAITIWAFNGFGELSPGIYEGSAQGYGGTLTLQVTVGDDNSVTAIDITNQSETAIYYERGKQIVDQIIEQQSVNIDAISGATYTSDAIKNAVKDALSKSAIGFAGGSGTQSDPYQIASEAGLRYLQSQVEAGTDYAGQYIELTDDIALTEEWTPIGTQENPFSGTFNGNNKTIRNLVMNGNSTLNGLFGYAGADADFININLEDVQITVEGSTTTVYAGAIVAMMKNDGTGNTHSMIQHCLATGFINVNTENQIAMVGGLVGMSNQFASITNNTSNIEVTVDTGSKAGNVGGLVGFMSVKALMMNNYASATVTMESSNVNSNAGGLAGTVNGISYNNISTGSVTGTDGTVNVGGIAGNQTTSSYLSNVYYTEENALGKQSGLKDDNTVLHKTVEELNTEEFAALLHDNLKLAVLSEEAEKVTAAGISGCTDFMAMLEWGDAGFYDWTVTDATLQLSSKKWVSTEYDTSIFESGDGTSENPYLISTEKQLRDFAVSLNDTLDYQGLYVKLGNDINVSAEEWTPIGEGEYAFMGNFNGTGYTVQGVTIGSEEAPHQDTGEVYYGFFGVLGSSASVYDLTLDVNVYVQSNASIYVSGLSGYIEKSAVDSVTVNGTVWGKSGMTKTAANHFSGGFAGLAYKAVITNCVSNANVYGEAAGGIGESGGILGLSNRSLIANCISTGAISGSANRELEGMASVGGITGVNAGVITNCVSLGDTLSETYSQYVGALAGWTTGIGKLYTNFYNADASQTIETQVVNPVVSIGWLVGPGVNDEGESYSGGIEYLSTALTGNELDADNLAEILNQNFDEFPVNLNDYDGIVLKAWENVQGNVVPTGEATSVSYKEPDIAEEEAPATDYSGVFYGRSEDETLILKVTVSHSIMLDIEVEENQTGEDVSNYLNTVLLNNSSDTITDETATATAVKESISKAWSKMEKNDTTAYGTVDASIFASGKGTKTSPYQIENETQLRAFAAALNADETYEGIYVELTKDITKDITLTEEWIPAGTDSHYPFQGILNGNGHKISNLYIGTKEAAANIQYAGFFAYIEGGTVENLIFENPYINTCHDDSSRIYAGTLAAFVDQNGTSGYIDKCQVTGGSINMTSASGAAYGAGLLGSAQYGTLTNSMVDAQVNLVSTGAWCYGGILSGISARMAIVNNRVTGTVTVNAPLNKAAAGGITGFHSGVAYNNVVDVSLNSIGTTSDVGALAGRCTGIGAMYDNYYNSEKLSNVGAKETNVSAVGTIVEGANDGKGVITGSTGLTLTKLSAQETIDSLNANQESTKEDFINVISLLSDSWGVTWNEAVTLAKWEKGDTLPVLNVTEQTEEETIPEETPVVKPVVKVPAQVSIKSVKSSTYHTAKITWSKVSNATGYILYRSTSKNGTYTKIKTITKSTTLSYTDTSLKTGTRYYYKVKAYNSAGNGKVSAAKSVKTVLGKVTISSVKNKEKKKAVITWKKVSGATGYEVYRATSKNGTYKKVKTVSSSKSSFTNSGLVKNKTYYYKVRAYRTVNGKKVYGAWSTIKYVKVNK